MVLIKNLVTSLICIVLFLTVPFSLTQAKEKGDTYEDLAFTLLNNLPLDKKMVLKSLSPEQSGIPPDFLIQLISNLEESLLDVSDFEVKLHNHLNLESLWEEAIEFKNEKFEDIYQASKSEILLMVHPRIITEGVDLSITAYSLAHGQVGRILASTGSQTLLIDTKKIFGAEVTDLNKQMAEVLRKIQSIGKTGGIIKEPKNYAEFYQNARILRQRGETDLALQNFEQAVKSDFLFVDPIEDLLSLLVARYNQKGAKRYYEKKVRADLPFQLQNYGDLYIGHNLLNAANNILNDAEIFSPYKSLFMRRHEGPYGTGNVFKNAWKNSIKHVHNDYLSGQLQNYYIDSSRAVNGGELATRWSRFVDDL